MTKVCTTIKQSRKLFELGIDIKTADMYYMYRHWEIDENTVGAQSDAHIGFDPDSYYGADNGKTYHYVPAWSLTALLGLIPKFSLEKDVSGNEGYQLHYNYNTVYYDDPIDAAFDMICWLKEHNKI